MILLDRKLNTLAVILVRISCIHVAIDACTMFSCKDYIICDELPGMTRSNILLFQAEPSVMAVMAKKSKKAKSGAVEAVVEPCAEAALGDVAASVEAEVEVKSEEPDVKKKKKKKNKVKEEAEENIVNAPESEPKIEVVPDVSSEEPPKKKKKKSKDKTAEKLETAAPVEENEQPVALNQEDQESHTPVNKEDDSGKSKNKGKGSVVNSSKHRLKVNPSDQQRFSQLTLTFSRRTSITYQTSFPSFISHNTD